MSGAPQPKVSVVIATHNRVDKLRRCLESVLSQDYSSFEVIVVNDGSTDATDTYLRSVQDDRLHVIDRENGGLSAARNSGIEVASGDWITFLDDDDWAESGWLRGFSSMISDGVGAVSGAAQYYLPDGELEFLALPWDIGPEFDNRVVNSLAGAFAVRKDLVEEIGGFEERMTCSHQTELWLRLHPLLNERGLAVRNTDRVLVALEARGPSDRPMSDPMALITGTEVLLSKHADAYRDHPSTRADLHGVVGVSWARLGEWARARSALFSSARAEPFKAKRWFRLLAAVVKPLGRRLWGVDQFVAGSEE